MLRQFIKHVYASSSYRVQNIEWCNNHKYILCHNMIRLCAYIHKAFTMNFLSLSLTSLAYSMVQYVFRVVCVFFPTPFHYWIPTTCLYWCNIQWNAIILIFIARISQRNKKKHIGKRTKNIQYDVSNFNVNEVNIASKRM